jgi:hypothetical protein
VQHIATVAVQPAAWKRMPEADAVDHAAFARLCVAMGRARRRRRLWMAAVVVASLVAFVMLWSTAMGVLLQR